MTTIVTVTEVDGLVSVNVECEQDRDVTVVEALGILEVGKVLLLGEQA